jgi:acyl carrier protein
MSDFDTRLLGVFADTFETTPDHIADDLSTENSAEWDSMRSIVLATSLEEEFGVEFSDDELVKLDSYQKIRSALVAKGVS